MRKENNEHIPDQKELYSIGDTAGILGVNVQTLRKYSNKGLVKPEYVDAASGYRYYSFKQFHIIDKIKYFRELDIPLIAIKAAFNADDERQLLSVLIDQYEKKEAEIREMQASLELFKQYIQYISYGTKEARPYECSVMHFSERYALAVDYNPETGYNGAETYLTFLRHSAEGRKLKYLRQFGYMLDYEKLVSGNFYPTREFMFTGSSPEEAAESIQRHILKIPEGDYLCFFIDKKELPRLDLGHFFNEAPPMALAVEYEHSISDYHGVKCQVELLLPDGAKDAAAINEFSGSILGNSG